MHQIFELILKQWVANYYGDNTIAKLFLNFPRLNFLIGPMLLYFKNCPMNVPYKISWILTLTEVISIIILRIRIISTIMNFYWSHATSLQKVSKERCYKFSWILTLTEVTSIRILRFFDRQRKLRPLNAAKHKRHIKKLFATTERQTDGRWNCIPILTVVS